MTLRPDPARLIHELAHGGALRENLDRIREIIVSRLFPAYKRSQTRQHIVQIRPVDPAQWGRRHREIEHQQMAAGPDDAEHFAKGIRPRSHVAQTESDREDIKRPVSKGQSQAVSHHEVSPPFFAGNLEHGLTEIGPDNQAIRAGDLEAQGQIPAARGQVENAPWIPGLDQAGGTSAPKKIQATAEQMVGKIVAPRNGGEHGAYPLAFIVRYHFLNPNFLVSRQRQRHIMAAPLVERSGLSSKRFGGGATARMFKPLLSKAKVLIVDDEPSNVRLLERILEMFGGTIVRSTTDPRQALPIFLDFKPDLVLLDLHMPKLDGFQVIEQLKLVVPSEEYLPILVLTADITIETKRRALASGAKDFVTKPLDHFEVVLRIKNLVENRFLRLELQKQNLELEMQVRERTAQLESTLSELRDAQERVVRQERLSALGMMAGGIAHDFNNALTMMLGYGELLLPYMQANAPAKELDYLRHVINAAQDATHIVRRLRDFYRPVSGNEIRVAIQISDLITQAVSLTAPKWKGKCQAEGIQINVTTEIGAVPEISGNAAELREVLTNLIFNAVDAMPDGGSIVVASSTQEADAKITVTDTGFGMTESERERCLEPFFTTKGELGTGLGLSVVYGIIQRHGGSIEIESEKGRGTTFSIILPSMAPTPTSSPQKLADLERSLRVLVADDEEIICELISEYLKADGHHAATAFNGEAALELFRSESFDLVITDQSMPKMNGEQLARAIAALPNRVPVILLTGFGEEMQAAGNHPEPIDLIVSKPVSAAELRWAIQQVTGCEPADD